MIFLLVFLCALFIFYDVEFKWTTCGCELLLPAQWKRCWNGLILKTAYKDNAMGKTQVYEWLSRFKKDDMSIDNKPQYGLPSTGWKDGNVEKIWELVFTESDLGAWFNEFVTEDFEKDRCQICVQLHYWWWVMVLILRPRNKATVRPMEDVTVSPSKKMSSQTKHQAMLICFVEVKGVVHS